MQQTTSPIELTGDQRRRWDDDGYLVLRGVLAPDDVARLLAAVDDVLARGAGAGAVVEQSAAAAETERWGAREPDGRAYKIAQAIAASDAFDALVDHPAILPLVLALMGPFPQVIGTEISVRTAGSGGEPLVPWHADGGPALGRFLPNAADPVLHLKVQFFLTDCTQPDSGNFALVPGSHRTIFPRDDAAFAPPPSALQLTVRAGDAVIFPWSLWHAVAPNRRGRVRKSFTVRYGQLWARPYDYERLPESVTRRLTPRRRRLFGDLGGDAAPSSYYYLDVQEQLRLMLDG
jgi:ectoine hydroxylase-related dioxygenase (phytanoyl-CoA dioxygenase family)